MTQQKTIFAPASFSIAENVSSSMARALLKVKIDGLKRGIIIHDDLISEIDAFCERNNCQTPVNELHTCCSRCLKAHAFRKAKEIGVSKDGMKVIFSLLNGKIGHEGYYMDGNELVKI